MLLTLGLALFGAGAAGLGALQTKSPKSSPSSGRMVAGCFLALVVGALLVTHN